MADITKCTGEGCPLRQSCYRYTAAPSERQSYFSEVPGRVVMVDGLFGKQAEWECESRWEVKDGTA